MTFEVVVPKPPQRITRALLEIYHASSHGKTSRHLSSPEVEVIRDSESDGTSLGEPPLNIPEGNDGMVVDRVSICRKKNVIDE